MRQKMIWIPVIVFFAMIGFMAAVFLRPVAPPDPMVGQAAPTIDLETLARDTARQADAPVSIINFWATWCTPCLAEHPALMMLADNGVNIEGIAFRDKPDLIEKMLTRNGDPFTTVYLDPDGEAMLDYGAAGVPESFIVDKSGKVLARITGPITPESLKDIVLPALDER